MKNIILNHIKGFDQLQFYSLLRHISVVAWGSGWVLLINIPQTRLITGGMMAQIHRSPGPFGELVNIIFIQRHYKWLSNVFLYQNKSNIFGNIVNILFAHYQGLSVPGNEEVNTDVTECSTGRPTGRGDQCAVTYRSAPGWINAKCNTGSFFVVCQSNRGKLYTLFV